jgi:hypothetical protein
MNERPISPQEPEYISDEEVLQIREDAKFEAFRDKSLLANMFANMPNNDDGDEVIQVNLIYAMNDSTSKHDQHQARIYLAVELEAMVERYCERCADQELVRRGLHDRIKI